MTEITQKMKIGDAIRFFYIKNFRFRFIRLYAYIKHLHRSSSGFELISDTRPQSDTSEMDLTMAIIKDNVGKYFGETKYDERQKIFYNLIESMQNDNFRTN